MVTIKNPLLLLYTEDGHQMIQIHPEDGVDHRHYGILVCDIVRHVARCFNVPEVEVWKYVEMERQKPTTEVTGQHIKPS